MLATPRSVDALAPLFHDLKRVSRSLIYRSHSRHLVGGVGLRMHASDAEIHRLLTAVLPNDQFDSNSSRSADIWCWHGKSADRTPLRLPRAISKLAACGEIDGGDTEQFRIAYNSGSRMLLAWDRQTRNGYAWTPEVRSLPNWERAAPLRSLFHWINQDSECQLAHAAVVEQDNRGVLLVGAGGSGKSSTSLSCSLAGMGFVGDDYVCLEQSAGTWQAKCVYRSLKVSPDFISTFHPNLQRSDVNHCEEMGKTILHVDNLPNAYPVSSVPLVAIAIPEVSGERYASIENSTIAAVLRALAPTTAFQLPYGSQQTFRCLSSICRNLPCFRLRLGTEIETNVACIRKLARESTRWLDSP